MASNVRSEPAPADGGRTRPTLSVACMTAGPGARVGAMLALLRPVADEIVVALDDRADEATLAAVGAVADLVVRYPYREPVDRPLRWLHSRCGGRWILTVDDDEIPGSELLAALPSLVAATDVTHYWLRRPWLWPDAATVIAEQPWANDYQLRLVANDARLLSYPTETHRPIDVLGPHRFVRAPLYHADALLSPLERREAKARKYEALRPGKRVGGGPMNHVLHLPERRNGLRTEPLPAADTALVAGVLDAAPPTSAAPTEAAVVSPDEIDALWAGRPLAEGDYRARIELLEEPERVLAGEQRTFDVRVENRGAVTWPWGEHREPEIRLSYRWFGADGEEVADGIRTAFPADVPPGDAVEVPLHVLAPAAAGDYRLRIDLVHEHQREFGAAVERSVVVERPPRVALVGPDEETLARLADESPAAEPVVLSDAPPPRFGPPQAPDLRPFLLHETEVGRRRDLPVLAARTASLLRAARALRRGEDVRPLLRGGDAFLRALAASTELLVVASAERVGVRELWLQWATIEAARALGVEPVVQRGGLARAHPLLVRAVERRARVVEPGELGL